MSIWDINSFRIGKVFRIFIEKRMINDYCIVVVFGIYYGFRITKVFRIVIEEGLLEGIVG